MATPTFADILRRSMDDRDINQARLALAAGLDPGRLSRILATPKDGETPTHPTAAQLVRLAEALGWDAVERSHALSLIAREW